mgnify:CR=1 FL=1
MRIFPYLLLSIFVISFTACSSDDDSSGGQADTLLGKWNASQFTMDGTFEEDGMTVEFSGIANDLTGNDATFKSDNTLTANNAPFDMELTFIFDGIPVTMTQTMSESMMSSGTWRKEGDLLYLKETGSDEEYAYTIETLNNTTLKLTGDQDSMEMDDDFPDNAIFNVSITFTR